MHTAVVPVSQGCMRTQNLKFWAQNHKFKILGQPGKTGKHLVYMSMYLCECVYDIVNGFIDTGVCVRVCISMHPVVCCPRIRFSKGIN